MTMATTIVCARYTVMLHVTQIKPPQTGYVVTYSVPMRRVASCSSCDIPRLNKPLARSHPSHKTHVKVVDFEKSRVARERGITPPCAVNSARFIRSTATYCKAYLPWQIGCVAAKAGRLMPRQKLHWPLASGREFPNRRVGCRITIGFMKKLGVNGDTRCGDSLLW